MTPPSTAPPTVPTVLPPVAADPGMPPTAAPPTVPTVSPLPVGLPPHAVRPVSAIPRTKRNLLMVYASGEKMGNSPQERACCSGAAAQQEDREQHRNRHAKGP